MPIGLCRGNHTIVKRIIKKRRSNEDKGSDASCYGEMEIVAMTIDDGKYN